MNDASAVGRQMDIDARASLSKRVIAVLNTGSGGCDVHSPGRMREVFDEAGLGHAEVIGVAPADLGKALDDAIARADVVVALGGDGTLRAAADKCGAAGKLLIPLSGGTMNMLPRALHGDAPWDQALAAALAAPAIRELSGGKADGQAFFCVAVMGAPSLWADVREALRGWRLVEALERTRTAIRRSSEALDFSLGDEVVGTAGAVAVICPLVAKDMRDDGRNLEAAALNPVAASGMFRLAFHAVFEEWRRDPSVTLARVKRVRVSGHGRVPGILDGEKVRLGRTVNLTFVASACRVIVAERPGR
ncbi:MAG TPA: diacylglycerol kinase family protein [Caulobacteraceae bacterium]|jgi:diacylglycerol kinase family enzyme|nr:diacylglycerol kinase family protein [Caulobacteraceae bacterium]